MKDRGSPGSVELITGWLDVVGRRIDEPNLPAGRPEQLDSVGLLVEEDLDDCTFRAGRKDADFTAQPYGVERSWELLSPLGAGLR